MSRTRKLTKQYATAIQDAPDFFELKQAAKLREDRLRQHRRRRIAQRKMNRQFRGEMQ